jgi:bifunctional enzyme CysN/CysC
MNVVIGGHVDHGKSTIVGRLLADTGALPEGKIEQVRAFCERTSRPFEYAFLLDALKDERAQGITIDASRVFFKSALRDYIIIDAPGHIEFLKNLITGAARADAALLVIDAHEGVQENSRRHGYMMSMLGVRQMVVLVNKMDLAGCDAGRFSQIETEFRAFLQHVGVRPQAFVPVIGRDGDNVANRSARLGWYAGPTVLDALDAFPDAPVPSDRPFRLPVQDVYKFTAQGDDRRIVAGTVESGTASVGDEIVFYPSGKRARIRSFEAFQAPTQAAVGPGQAVGFTLGEQIYVARGEVATRRDEEAPAVGSRFRASVFWLGRRPLVKGRDYTLKIGSARTAVRMVEIHGAIDAASLASVGDPGEVGRHEVAECTLACQRAIAFDLPTVVPSTSRFVLVDDFEIAGGGIIREVVADQQAAVRRSVLLRESRWEPSLVGPERRAARFAQRPTVVVITGPKEADRKGLARRLEARLFEEGRVVYFLAIGNVVYGVDADLERSREIRREHVRRLAEIANLMLDAGLILIVSAQNLEQDDLALVTTTVDPDRVATVWLGGPPAAGRPHDLTLDELDGEDRNVEAIHALLAERRVLFRPW